jgi:hypothetical protein
MPWLLLRSEAADATRGLSASAAAAAASTGEQLRLQSQP